MSYDGFHLDKILLVLGFNQREEDTNTYRMIRWLEDNPSKWTTISSKKRTRKDKIIRI